MFDLQSEILSILKEYLAVDSITGTEGEKRINPFFDAFIRSVPYFQKNTGHFGSDTITDDPLERKVHWAMLKGRGDKTIVLVHHCDIVNIENYNDLKPEAYAPESLRKRLLANPQILDREALGDLYSEKWIFGRGTADMKGGGAVQLALLKELSRKNDFEGNIVLLMVPDEENLSAGMRHGVKILRRLKENHHLDYQLMINSEPHQRVQYDKGIISQGSIAKMNFFVYVKGILTHAGKVLEGLNPIGIMSGIISKTELSMDFVDEIEGEMSVPPTWIGVKDTKSSYDISTPEAVIAYLNILNFSTPPEEILNKLKKICIEETDLFMGRYRSAFEAFQKKTNRENTRENWKINILTFDELLSLLREVRFESYGMYEQYRDKIADRLRRNELTFIGANQLIIEHVLKSINLQEIFIITGLTMPLYPAVSNVFLKDPVDYLKIVNDFAGQNWGQTYMNRNFFTGISDLSYSSLNYDLESTLSQMKNMPLWDHYYSIPFEDIQFIQMPCVNIGPWGKDFHKISERVFREDLLERTPLIIKNIIEIILKEGE